MPAAPSPSDITRQIREVRALRADKNKNEKAGKNVTTSYETLLSVASTTKYFKK
jgi:hypothetical protein